MIQKCLVGRIEELGGTGRLPGRTRPGPAGVIELVGEGIGKTRLLRELTVRADGRGHLALSGSASELESDLPFSVFVDAVNEYVGSLELGRLLLDTVQGLAHTRGLRHWRSALIFDAIRRRTARTKKG